MNARLPRGIVTISIDLEVESPLAGQVAERSVAEITFWLIEVLNKFELPATWAVADPTASATGERVLSLSERHEIAVLGEAAWIGREAGRGRFGRELARRTTRAHGGAAISTLVLRSGELSEQADLAIKHGITAVRQPPSVDAGRLARLQPQTLRYGLWSFPISLRLPGNSRWLPGGGGLRAARAGIERAIAGRGLFQLVIDAPRLAVLGSSARRLVERVLESAQRWRRQGELDVANLRTVADRLSSQQRSQPSHSILRPAA